LTNEDERNSSVADSDSPAIGKDLRFWGMMMFLTGYVFTSTLILLV